MLVIVVPIPFGRSNESGIGLGFQSPKREWATRVFIRVVWLNRDVNSVNDGIPNSIRE